ncbi:MAG: VWA domain-containing protein [Clostridiales bacterium]|nr:VWA domain-containing protein [Clostridiales bacterium]
MSFYYPLGLLGLIGIPIIIFIYIIKSKYTEQTIASTYLWELSEKFLKRRKPISKLTGIVTLILQLLAVVALSLLVAHPVFTVADSANDFYFIVDGSASMNMKQGDDTRFERGRDKITELIDDAKTGSSYTIVFVGDSVNVVCEGVTDKAQAKVYVEELSAGWTASDCASAVSVVQNYFDANRSGLIYLVTDKEYEVNDAITLVDVSEGERNFAFHSASYENGVRGVNGVGEVVSYSSDATIAVEMWVSPSKGAKPVLAGRASVSVKAGEPKEFSIRSEFSQYAYIELRITNADALAEDNVVVIYDSEKMQERNVLIVSDSTDTTYLLNAIRDSGKANVDVMATKDYEKAQASGYGMYVFNGYAPKTLPVNAAVWLVDGINGGSSGSNVSFRNYQPSDDPIEGDYRVGKYSTGSSAAVTMFTKDLVRREVYIAKYAKYTARGFTSVMSVEGDDVVFAGLNANGDRQVVFAFRIGDSNLGLLDDFLILIRNLMNYSFPSVLDETVYSCGDTMNVNVVPGCENIVVVSPSGKSNTLDTVGNDVCEVLLNETGVYTLNVKISGSDEMQLCAFARVPEAESRPDVGGAMLLVGEREFDYSDGFYDDLLAFFIVIAVLLLADWAVYCYEQYQLR